MPDAPGTRRDGSRGQSEVLAVVLLVAMSMAVIALVVLASGVLVDDAKQSGQVAHAENEFREFDTEASGVAYGDADRGEFEFDHVGSDRSVTREEGAWLRVRVRTAEGVVNVTNVSLGTVTYERGRTEVAYQGGGVWRSDGDGSVVRSPPDVGYHDGTLMVDVLSIGGDASLTGSTRLVRADRRRAFPDLSNGTDDDGTVDSVPVDDWSGRTNPFGHGTVTITVHSEYYDAWGRYFERNLGGMATYDHDAETTTVWFFSTQGNMVRPGIRATARTGNILLEGTGAYVDSYDSSEGDYAATATDEGHVHAVGDVNITGDGTIAGDIESGDHVDLSGDAEVYGDVNYTNSYDTGTSTTITGETRDIDGVPTVLPIDDIVYAIVDNARGANDNGRTGVIEDDRLSVDGSSAELGPGRYYLDRLHLQGEELVLNATGGNVTIAVQDWIQLERSNGKGSTIAVEGNGTVRIFVAARNDVTVSPTGLGEREVNLHVGKRSHVTVPDQDAKRLWVLAPRDFNATVAGSQGKKATFDGVVYAPAGFDGSGYTYVKQGEVFGAVVTGDLTLGQYGLVHFDRSLPGVFRYNPSSSGIEYLHATVYRVNATS